MAKPTYAVRIDRLKRQREELRAQLALVAPGSRKAAIDLTELIEYLTSTLRILANRHGAQQRAAAAVSKQAPRVRPAARVLPIRRAFNSPPPVSHALPLPASFGAPDHETELVTSWTGADWRTA